MRTVDKKQGRFESFFSLEHCRKHFEEWAVFEAILAEERVWRLE
jgi:hypothetical protein